MRRLLMLLVAIAASITTIYLPANAFANEEESTLEETAINEPKDNTWLQISPVSKRLSLNPNETVSHTFKVKNTGDKDMKVKVYSTPYSTVSGTTDLDFKSESNYTQISRWISFLDGNGASQETLTFSIGVGDERTVTYRVSVPEDVAAGGQYASIFAEAVPTEENLEGIATTTRVGMLLYARVKGETHSSAKFSNIQSNHISTSGKISVSADVENAGNIDYQATMGITVSTIFGREIYNNTVVSSILPESTKKIYAEWGGSYGIYRLRYVIKALDSTYEKSHIVLIMPIGALVIGIILLIATIVAITYLTKRKKQPLIAK